MSKRKVKIWQIEPSTDQEVRLERYFELFNLDGAGHSYKLLKEKFMSGEMRIDDFMENLFTFEKDWREMKKINRWIQFAKFPFEATLKDFLFEFPDEIDKRQILELDSISFVKDGKNVIFHGPTGVGKTHISIVLGRTAMKKGIEVRFFELKNLARLIAKTKNQEPLNRLISVLTKIDLLILDDMRPPEKPLNPIVSDILYDVIVERHEKMRSIIISTRTEFDGWERIFGNVNSAQAMIDRMGQRKIVVTIKGKSYRAADQMKTEENFHRATEHISKEGKPPVISNQV